MIICVEFVFSILFPAFHLKTNKPSHLQVLSLNSGLTVLPIRQVDGEKKAASLNFLSEHFEGGQKNKLASDLQCFFFVITSTSSSGSGKNYKSKTKRIYEQNSTDAQITQQIQTTVQTLMRINEEWLNHLFQLQLSTTFQGEIIISLSLIS